MVSSNQLLKCPQRAPGLGLFVTAILVGVSASWTLPAGAQESGYQVIRGTRVFTQINHAAGVATFSNDCGSQTLTQGQLQAGAYPDQIIPCPRPSQPSQIQPPEIPAPPVVNQETPLPIPGNAEGYRRAAEKEQQCNRLANANNYFAAAMCYSQAAQMYVDTSDTTEDVDRMNRLAQQMRSKIASSASGNNSRNINSDRGSCSQPAISYINVKVAGKTDCVGAGCYVFENSCKASAIKVFYQASDGFGSNCSVLQSRNITAPAGSPGTAIDFSCSFPQVGSAEFTK